VLAVIPVGSSDFEKGVFMVNTLFLQFYTKQKSERSDMIYHSLGNGYSDVWDICTSRGDMYWHYQEGGRQGYSDKQSPFFKLPITKGTVYVSAVVTTHLYQTLLWAQAYPNIKFVVGGSACRTGIKACDTGFEMPKNLVLTDVSIEEYFGQPEFSQPWKLELPDNLDKSLPIFFNYKMDDSCFWGKCIFCQRPAGFCKPRKRTKFNFEFEHLDYPALKMVWLDTQCISPVEIKQILPSLPIRDDIKYTTFMRGSNAEAEALKEVCKSKDFEGKLKISLGIELPTNRMLKYIKKGVSVEEILNFIHVCTDNNISVRHCYISGWDNLTKQDILDVRDYVSKLPKDTGLHEQVIFHLMVSPGTPIYEMWKGRLITSTSRVGPFVLGWHVKIPPEQIILNRKIRNILIPSYKLTINNCPSQFDIHGEGTLGGNKYKLDVIKSIKEKPND
jgi:hypothetical protein